MSYRGRYAQNNRKGLDSEIGRWLISFGVSLFIVLLVFTLIKPVFKTIDDARLKYVYAGYSSGQPESVYLFCLFPLSWLLSKLYTFFPNVQWYALYHFFAIVLSSTLIGKTVYKKCRARAMTYPVAIAVHIFLYISLSLISTIMIHFEITAAMLGTACVALVLGIDFKKDFWATRLVDMVLALFCISASFVIQATAFYASCCYMLVVFMVYLLKGIQSKTLSKTSKQMICWLVCVVVAIVCIKLLDNHVKDTALWDEYRVYNKYRVPYWDYPHMSYQDTPELFESLGWSEEFYNLTQYMYFMDSRFNAETLSQIVEPFSWFAFDKLGSMFAQAVSTFEYLFTDEPLALVHTCMFAVLIVTVVLLSFNKQRWKKHYPELIGLYCTLLGTVLLAIYLATRGRLPLRAWTAFVLPCGTVSVLLLTELRTKKKRKMKHRISKSIVACVLLCLWCGGMIWSYHKLITDDYAYRKGRNEVVALMEEYAASHPENIYIYDHNGAQNYDVFSSFPDKNYRPSNAFVWGSSYLWTQPYYNQLKNNGIDQLLTENLFDDNVYYIGHVSRTNKEALYNMLMKDYGSVRFDVVEYLADKFVVYKISMKVE